MDTEQKVEDLRDETMALRFAFMTLARALHQHKALPLPVLIEQLQAVAEQIGQPESRSDSSALDGASAHLSQLCASLSLLQ